MCVDCNKGVLWLSADGDAYVNIEYMTFTPGSVRCLVNINAKLLFVCLYNILIWKYMLKYVE